jgi:hypothetical protein
VPTAALAPKASEIASELATRLTYKVRENSVMVEPGDLDE